MIFALSLVVLAWLAIGLVVGFIFGRMAHIADVHDPFQED